MKQITLELGPVYSRLADDGDKAELAMGLIPAIWGGRLRRHQAETWRLYNNPDVDVIINTVLTGDGKSLAGQLPMYADDARALLLYPTNELIRDQLKQVQRYMRDFGVQQPLQTLYSEQISEELEQTGASSRSSVIMNWFKNRHFILSNPDLFHLLSSYNYGSAADKRDFSYQIPAEFDYFNFDEFHLFGPPQIVSIVNIMNYHKVAYPNRRIKYVFLSATPKPLFKNLLRNSGFRVQEVKGDYSAVPAAGYTPDPIVQPVSLHLHSLDDRGAYAWAETHLEELVQIYESVRTTKGVFIVNSVATAKRLIAFYRQELQEKHGILVGENTNLTRPEDRREAMENPDVRLIIATSTVDVGVDFAINLLIFESTGAATFIQRLGRLGRHHKWTAYRAYALLPDWTVERFAEHFVDGSHVERVAFLDELREQHEFGTVKDSITTTIKPIFQPEQEYRRYTACWGGLQAAHILVQAREVGKHYGDFPKELKNQYNAVYKHAKNADWIGGQIARYKDIADSKYDKKILTELNTFRGRSPIDCGIFDETDQSFKTYNLFFLLANTRFTPLKEQDFRKLVEAHGQRFERYQSRDLQLYVRLERYIEEREQFNLCCQYSFKGKLNQVHVYDSFFIQDSRVLANHLDNSVNDRLSETELVCLVAPGKARDFKRQNHLPPLFPVYQVRDRDGMERCVMFGLEAFLAHSLVSWKTVKDEDDEDEPLIF